MTDKAQAHQRAVHQVAKMYQQSQALLLNV